MTLLGKYELRDLLGRGAFGSVYRAYDPSLEIERAIKILHAERTNDISFLVRFRREGMLAVKLDHPGIVPVYELNEFESQYYLVMKYMPGGSLGDRLKKEGRLPFQQVVEILKQVAAGLDYAHAQGVIHRDIKPANILLEQNGAARLGDFGFARALDGEESSSGKGLRDLVGTAAYIAPEIWDGQPATPASDQYSLACVACEMLTGQVMFSGPAPASIMRSHLRGPQFPTQWPQGVPQAAAAVLKRALAQEPRERFASAGEFARQLAGCAKDDGGPGPGPTPNPLYIAIPVVLVAMGLLGWFGRDIFSPVQTPTPTPTPTIEVTITTPAPFTPTATQFTPTPPPDTTTPSPLPPTPDTPTATIVKSTATQAVSFPIPQGSPIPRQLSVLSPTNINSLVEIAHWNQLIGANQLVFSKDGQRIASFNESYDSTDHMIRIWDARTGSLEKEINAFSNVLSFDFSPDGKKYFLSSNTDIPNNTANIYAYQTNKVLKSLDSGKVGFAFFIDDNTLLLPLGDEPVAYDLTTGRQISKVPSPYSVAYIKMTADFSAVVYISWKGDGVSRLYAGKVTDLQKTPADKLKPIIITGFSGTDFDISATGNLFAYIGCKELMIGGWCNGWVKQVFVKSFDQVPPIALKTYDLQANPSTSNLPEMIALNPTGTLLAIRDTYGNLEILSVQDKSSLRVIPNQAGLTMLRFSTDGKILYALGDSGLTLWSVPEK